MMRHIFWVPLCALLLALGVPVDAQQPKKISRVGYLAAVSAAADAPRLEAFRQGLRELGYIEGQNMIIEYRHEGGGFERLPELGGRAGWAKARRPGGSDNERGSSRKKSDHDDPHRVHGRDGPGDGWTGGKPGAAWGQHHGNHEHGGDFDQQTTGVTQRNPSHSCPALRSCGIHKRQAPCPSGKTVKLPAQELGLHLYSMEVSSVENYEAAFKEAVEARNTALWVTLNPLANSNQKKIADLAINHGLPSICARSDYAENGCMMAYGPGYGIEGKDGARYVDKILKGAKPADIPVEQPMKFELVINLQTAHKLGLTIPQSVLFQADKIIK